MPDNLLRPQDIAHHADFSISTDLRAKGWLFGIFLDIFTVLFSIAFGLSYRFFLAHRISPWIVVISMVLFAVMSGVQAIVNKNRKRRLLMILLEVICLGLCFYDFDLAFVGSGAVLTFLFLWWGWVGTRRAFDSSLEVRFFTNTKPVIGRFMTATLLFMVLLYVPQLTSTNAFLPQGTFVGLFDWSAGLIGKWYPDIPLLGSFGDFAEGIIQHELSSNPNFEALPSSTQSTTIAQNANQLVSSFSNDLGFGVNASDTLAVVMYHYMLNNISGWKNRFASTFLIGWSILVFLILRSAGIVFTVIAQFLLGVIYELLLILHVIEVREVPATQEVIGYR